MIGALECAACAAETEADRLRNLCPECGAPLLARYDLASIARRWSPGDLAGRPRDIWRWREVLPIEPGETPLTLGEGGTPEIASRSIGPSFGLSRLAFKDESGNPTLSFKARGLAVAVHRARALGALHLAIPSAGNAGSATAAYAAAAGLACTVAMPWDTPAPILAECRLHGARVELVEGTIAEAGAWIRERAAGEGWFDVSTLREPYRLEGKKTMGYELAEARGWALPDVIVYPTGGGTGLIGMWKAFDELEALGWIGPGRPRMVSVQAAGCAPIVAAFEAGADRATAVRDPRTVASGLKVPGAIGDFLILAAVRRSGGTALAVEDAALLGGARRLAAEEGILASPEAGATVAALPALIGAGLLEPHADVVCFVTGHGIKYPVLCDSAPGGVSSDC
ncbi:MAG TPA: threonine synthase [Gemmatimonadota bacterium]|nr:threonine synthase [Gemmatimonadota bacterium]